MTIAPGIFREYDIRGRGGQGPHRRGRTRRRRGLRRLPGRARTAPAPLVVGRDNRPSGGVLRDALVRGPHVERHGRRGHRRRADAALYWSLNNLDVAGGIQITGSHNPPEFNGFKICLGTASVYGAEIQKLYRLTQAPLRTTPGAGRSGQRAGDRPVHRRHRGAHRAAVPAGARGVSTAATGRGRSWRHSCSAARDRAGAACSARATGPFPTTTPTHRRRPTSRTWSPPCAHDGAELGIAFDGDADRIGVVDDSGNHRLGRPAPDPLRARRARAHRYADSRSSST